MLPFRYRGPASEDYLGDGLAEQLIDALSTTRGLRVLGAGATSRYKDERDPRVAGRDLGVDVMVDGSVQRSGDQLRITARLVDVATGTQLWSEHFNGVVADMLALEGAMSQRIAEALRVELTTIGDEGTQSPEAIDLYFRGRRELRKLAVLGPDGAVALFERCLEIAPAFKLAIAGHAIASLKAWFVRTAFGDRSADWQGLATASVARAVAGAADLAETHLAAGILAAQRGEYGAAGSSLRRALAIAPTYADAHDYLGGLLCEASRPDEGLKHLKLAVELEPTLVSSLVGIARHHALSQQWPEYERIIAELGVRHGTGAIFKLQLELRVAAWRRDLEAIRRALDELPSGPTAPEAIRAITMIARYSIGEIPLPELEEGLARMHVSGANLRFIAVARQTACEAFCAQGRQDLALASLRESADAALVDLAWLDKCPLLVDLRKGPEFAEIRRRVRGRAEQIWTSASA